MPMLGTEGCSPSRSPRLVLGAAVPSLRRSITPNGQAATQVPHPLQTSCCTTTVPNSVRNSAPVGHTSRHAASVQCLQTSEDISHRSGSSCSMNATWRQVFAPSASVLSYDLPLNPVGDAGIWFHSLQAT